MAISNRSLSNSSCLNGSLQSLTVKDHIDNFLARKFRKSRSFATTRSYKNIIKKFQEFLKLRYNLDIVQLVLVLESKGKDPLDVLDEYYTFLSTYQRKDSPKPYANSTIKDYVTTAKEFLNSVGCKIYVEDMKRKFTLPKRSIPYEEGLTKEQINRVIRLSNSSLATVILLACSGGMRIAEIMHLRVSDIDFAINPTTITLRAETTKTREMRKICITSEAKKALEDYLAKKNISGDSQYLFLNTHQKRISKLKQRINENTYKNQIHRSQDRHRLRLLEVEIKKLSPEEQLSKCVNTARQSYEGQLAKVRENIPELSKRNSNGRNNFHFHALRAWFKTQVTDVHESDFAESLMGHKSIKLVYYRQNEKKRSETYLKVEHALTISDTEAVDKNYSFLEKDNLELRGIVDSLAKQLQNLETRIKIFN